MPLAVLAFACPAVGLGLLLGAGPVDTLAAPLEAVCGVVSVVSSRGRGGRGPAVGAVVIGSIVSLLSLMVSLGSHPT